MYRFGDVIYGGRRGDYDKEHWHWDFKPILEIKSVITQIKTYPKGVYIGYGKSFITYKEKTVLAVIPYGYGGK